LESLFIAFIVLLLIIFYLGLGIWVFAGLLLVSVTALVLLVDMDLHRIGTIVSPLVIRSATAWEISAIPMFIWMGEIMLRTDISNRLFRGLAPLTYYLPGRLLHTNIAGSALFAAVSGSSAATTASVGKITMTELSKRNYAHSLTYGSLAGAGSLGLLIPPSIVMIVYGVLAEVSIARLFAAGVVPGLMLAVFYAIYVGLVCIARPQMVPADEVRPGWREIAFGLWNLLPIAILIVAVLGSIYSGIATPSEAAAVGVVTTLLLTLVTRQFRLQMFFGILISAVQTSCIIAIILIAASFLSTAMGFLHVPQDVATAIGRLDLTPFQLIAILGGFYVILGMFLEGISITVMCLPITLSLVISSGFDPIWFGVFLVIMVVLAQITPPIGFNLFIIQGLTNPPIMRVALYAAPFFALMCFGAALITIFPEIALTLPELLFARQ